MRWLVRLALTALVAAVMAVIGYQLTFKPASERWTLDEQSFFFVGPSVLLWLALAFVLYRQNYITAVGWGLLSPILGSLFVGGLAGPFLVLTMWYAAFPVGVLTGVLVKLCLAFGSQTPNPSGE